MNEKAIYGLGSSSEATYEVGYKKPPKHAQFKPGQKSANPHGRAKKKKDDIMELMLRELERRISIEENGQRLKVSKREVLVKQIVKKALMGDGKCLEFILRVEGMRPNTSPEKESEAGPSERYVSPTWKKFLRDSKAKKLLT